jgi:hypothetical protein
MLECQKAGHTVSECLKRWNCQLHMEAEVNSKWGVVVMMHQLVIVSVERGPCSLEVTFFNVTCL